MESVSAAFDPTKPSSASVVKVVTALSKAQAQVKEVRRNLVGFMPTRAGGYDYGYAGLDEVYKATREAQAANGLALYTPFEVDDSRVFSLRIYLTHESGEWLNYGTYPLGTFTNHQALGGAISYARRYIEGVVYKCSPQDDDDAAGATDEQKRMAEKKRAAQTADGSQANRPDRMGPPPRTERTERTERTTERTEQPHKPPQTPEKSPQTPTQDRTAERTTPAPAEKAIDPAEAAELEKQKLVMKGWPVDKVVSLVQAADTVQLLDFVVDGAEDGEAWISLPERAQIFAAIREQFANLVKTTPKDKRDGTLEAAFKEKMVKHKGKLELDQAAEALFHQPKTEAPPTTDAQEVQTS